MGIKKENSGNLGSSSHNIKDLLTSFSPSSDFFVISSGDGRIKISMGLPDELLHEVFARMIPYSLGRAACVCRKWRYTIRNPVFWRSACLKAWQIIGAVENYRIFQFTYQGSWRKMWLLRPRIHTDGLYVSRNTYVRCGTPEWKTSTPVHVVASSYGLPPTPARRALYIIYQTAVPYLAERISSRMSSRGMILADSQFDELYGDNSRGKASSIRGNPWQQQGFEHS